MPNEWPHNLLCRMTLELPEVSPQFWTRQLPAHVHLAAKVKALAAESYGTRALRLVNGEPCHRENGKSEQQY